MAIWMTLMRQHLKCVHQQVASVVGIGAFDGLAQPSTDRKPAKSRGKARRARGKGNPLRRRVESRQS